MYYEQQQQQFDNDSSFDLLNVASSQEEPSSPSR